MDLKASTWPVPCRSKARSGIISAGVGIKCVDDSEGSDCVYGRSSLTPCSIPESLGGNMRLNQEMGERNHKLGGSTRDSQLEGCIVQLRQFGWASLQARYLSESSVLYGRSEEGKGVYLLLEIISGEM
jgi:hypothetical protein